METMASTGGGALPLTRLVGGLGGRPQYHDNRPARSSFLSDHRCLNPKAQVKMASLNKCSVCTENDTVLTPSIFDVSVAVKEDWCQGKCSFGDNTRSLVSILTAVEIKHLHGGAYKCLRCSYILDQPKSMSFPLFLLIPHLQRKQDDDEERRKQACHHISLRPRC
ncbi:uncharacterized protein LOC124676605 isoform X2 [Lolium rigidum]|uniref:uncharacterized protein LOC124676605 isoform X2 n=1 Tax=Lolium rigidum TaxID=89674 RepID=UPI001F5C6BB6|nr:uncharacterized protein LOC124676605 isoform X2 [Lolium rigidum]